MLKNIALGALALALVACKGGDSTNPPTPTPTQPNNAPVANAGADFTTAVSPEPTSLPGSGTDADNDSLSYSWAVTTQPAGASTALGNSSSATASFSTSVPGDYVFTLTVSDGKGGTASDSVAVTLTNDAPVVSVATYSRTAAVGVALSLDASGSSDVNGQTLTFSWDVTDLPASSAIPVTYAGAQPSITFDVHGIYTLRLSVTDGYETVSQVLDPIDVSAFTVMPLLGAAEDAEFSATKGRIVTIAGQQLTIINTQNFDETVVSLPVAARTVALSPDGASAAVGHNGWVSYINVDTGTRQATHNVPDDVGDIVVDAQGYAHIMPARDQWVNMSSINLVTGATRAGEGTVRAGTNILLHPSGTKVYGANNGLSPSDLERYDISSGMISRAYDSPYHGDYPFCGDLWNGPEGATILSRCGVVVRATEIQSSDLTYVMQLAVIGSIRHASASAYDNKWYVIQEATRGEIDVYDVDTGEQLDGLTMPVISDDSSDRWQASFVFASDSSPTLYVLAADSVSAPSSYALLVYSQADITGGNLPPKASVQRYTTVRMGQDVVLDGSGSSDPEGDSLTYVWTLEGQPEGSDISLIGATTATPQFTPLVTGTYEFTLRVNDGSRSSAIDKATVNVFATGADMVHRVEGSITDIEYSKALNAAVYLDGNDARTLHIVRLSTFSDTTVALSRPGYRVGVAPDGTYAAVSHAGMVSLVNLATATVADTQEHGADWGDIVLDGNHRAHLVPNRDQWTEFMSFDFATNSVSSVWGVYADTQLRMHPKMDWVYGADRGLSPSDFEKWDVSSFPSSSLGDSPYHGTYEIAGNIWISEDGVKLLVLGGYAFHSSATSTDKTYAGRLSDSVTVQWADHAEETDEWAVLVSSGVYSGKLAFYDGQYLNRLRVEDLAPVPVFGGTAATTGTHVFLSDDGKKAIIVLDAEGLVDSNAIEVMTLSN